jgi:V8-like Glu-specific endopeptidase
MDHEVEESQAQGAEMALATDNRYLVKDSHSYPHNAIAFMQMEFDLEDGDLGEFAAQALCARHIFTSQPRTI